MRESAIQGLLIGIGVPILMIGILLPTLILRWKSRNVYDQIPETTKNKYGLQSDQESSSRGSIVVFGALLLLVLPVEFLGPLRELVFKPIAMAILAVSALIKAVHYGKLMRADAELPHAIIRYARYSCFGMSLLFVVGGAGATLTTVWALRE